jgi:hypothetical protein
MKQIAGVLLTMLLAGGAASVAIITETAILNGPSEAPPNASAGTGVGVITIDTILNTLTVHVTFSGLTGTTTASHIHCCFNIDPNARTAGVATTTPTFAGFPLGVTSGTYDNTLDLTSASSYNPAFVTAAGSVGAAETALINSITSYQAYLNIHTSFATGGEIRGFIVPEPTTMLLIGAGLAGFVLIRRRRQA